MNKIIFDPENGLVFPDGKMVEEVLKLIKEEKTFSLGSELSLDIIRIEVLKNKFPDSFDRAIFINNERIEIDKSGVLKSWEPFPGLILKFGSLFLRLNNEYEKSKTCEQCGALLEKDEKDICNCCGKEMNSLTFT